MKKVRKIPLAVYIVAAAIPILLFAGSIVNSVIFFRQYRVFTEDFAYSVNYAMENECMIADYEGKKTQIVYDNDQYFYNTIVSARISDYVKDVPSSEPITINFGNDCILQVWKKDIEVLTVKYVYADGSEVVFETLGEVRFIDLERLISVEWDNIAVAE